MRIQSKPNTKEYEENYDRIFNKKRQKQEKLKRDIKQKKKHRYKAHKDKEDKYSEY